MEPVLERLGRLMKRAVQRQLSLASLKGLLGAVERANVWRLAEWIGEETSDTRTVRTIRWRVRSRRQTPFVIAARGCG